MKTEVKGIEDYIAKARNVIMEALGNLSMIEQNHILSNIISNLKTSREDAIENHQDTIAEIKESIDSLPIVK